MGECPVCGDRPLGNLELHVASHFEGPSEPREAPVAQATLEAYNCPICEFPLTDVNQTDRQTHVDNCMSGGRDRSVSPYGLDEYDDEQDRSEDETAYAALDRRKGPGRKQPTEWDGPAKPGAWQGWVGRKIEKGDEYWDPVSAGEGVPRNVSPGLIPVLSRMLNASVQQSKTRSAALSRDTVHIRGVWGFDMGFGCGYRNALMAISALSIHDETVHRIFSKDTNGIDPGIRRIQGWIEEAWAAGYDIEGRDQLKGKLLGTRKWIGATDLHAMFTSKGVRCDLYDFKKPERGLGYRPAHKALQEWVKVYFGPEDDGKKQTTNSQGDAFQALMTAARDGTPRVTRSPRYPLILQHSGHSRTIVGYEETTKGEINLLLFDPGRRAVPSDLRAAGLAEAGPSKHSSALNRSRTISQPSMSKHRSSHEAMPFSRPYTNGASELVHLSDDEDSSRSQSLQAKAARIQGGGAARPQLEEDEYEDKHGWIKKKIRKVTRGSGPPARPPELPGSQAGVAGKEPWGDIGLSKALGYFRVNLASLGTHAQYQVLAFPGGPLLTPSEQQQRKTLSSTEVW